ncbi:MAG: methyltransferase domain-containing protein [Gammaproteobacteria bacterium]|jgi:ubiquinone/menaquinone biosynthesis C-methylase UbiE
MVAITSLQREQILHAVKQMYTDVASCPDKPYHFPTGRSACLVLGYSAEMLVGLPESVLESFAGVGCPLQGEPFRAGDHILDIGSGSGTDTLIAARQVGERGRVYCLDLTEAMLDKLCHNAARQGVHWLVPILGNAESIPLPAACVDGITSNGVLNLVPDKAGAFRELYRVLRPGGRLRLADVAVSRDIEVLEEARDIPRLWAECVVGAVEQEQYVTQLESVGFEDVAVIDQTDYFSHSISERTRDIARAFGANSIVIQARKPAR